MISTIKTALDAIQSTVSFIQAHFKAIEIGLGGFIAASGLAKLGEMARGISEIFNVGRAVINVGVQESPEGAKAGWIPRALTAAGGALATGETLGVGATVGTAIAAGAIFKPAEQRAMERMGVAADQAAEALAGFPTAIHSVTDKIPLVGSALGALASAATAAAAQIAMIPAAMGDMLLHPWQATTPGALDELHKQQSDALKTAGKTQSDVEKHWQRSNAISGQGGIVTRPHVGLVGEAGPEAIIPLSKAGGAGLLGGVTVNAPITINGPVADQGDLGSILVEHANEIARAVQRALQIQWEQEAVV